LAAFLLRQLFKKVHAAKTARSCLSVVPPGVPASPDIIRNDDGPGSLDLWIFYDSCDGAAHNLKLALIACWNFCSMRSVGCFESSKIKKEEIRDDIRVGGKRRSLDNGRLRDSEGLGMPLLG
jgi:hypothetical protein